MKLLGILLCFVMSSSLASAQDFSIDDVEILVEPKQDETILGENYEATIGLSHALPDYYEMSCTVNGRRLVVDNQKSRFVSRSTILGKQLYKIVISLRNTKNETIKVLEKTVSYDIELFLISLWVDKMNVCFVGVDNPISIASNMVKYEDMEVTASGAEVIQHSKGNYIIRPKKTGMVTVKIYDKKSERTRSYEFRAKRIPDPVVRLGKIRDNKLTVAELKKHLELFNKSAPSLAAWLDNFDFEARCKVTSFTFLHYRKKRRKLEQVNEGARCQESITKALQNAKSGDVFIFTDIKGTCPMDKEDRLLNSVILKIE